jgi:tetratricopeptide (TPR) repeat protein
MTACALAVVIALAGSAVWFGQRKATRRAETDRAVTAALAQAKTLVAEGDKQIDHPERWQAAARLALAAQEKAEELFAAGEGSDELAGRVRQVRAAVDEAVTDSSLLVGLDRIWLAKTEVNIKENHFDEALAAPLYAELLGRYGVDLAAPETAAARVRTSRLREALLSALADWQDVSQDAGERQRVAKVYELALPPNSLRARWMEAVRREDVAELVKLAKEPACQELRPASLVWMARRLEENKEWAAAEHLLRGGLERKPGDFWLNHGLGMLLRHQQPPRSEEAARYLTAAVALRHNSPGVYLNLGLALKESKDLEGAIRCFKAALQIDPNYADAHNSLGNALVEKNQLDAAIREFRAAIGINFDLARAHNNLAVALSKKGMLDEAIVEYRVAIPLYRAAFQRDPRQCAHRSLGDLLRDKGLIDQAITEYREAIRLKKDDSAAHNNLGLALQQKGAGTAAIAEFRTAIQIDPNFVAAHINLGAALFSSRNLEEAIDEFRIASKLDAKNPAPHRYLNRLLSEKGDLDGAIHEARLAVQIDPHSGTRYALGTSLMQKGLLDEAVTEFREAIRLSKEKYKVEYPEAHCNLGHALLRQGKFKEAVVEFRRGHKLGLRAAGWAYPSAAWLNDAERLAKLDSRLPKMLKGEDRPADPGERRDLAILCQMHKQLYAAAARWYGEAFAEKPALAQRLGAQGSRYDAACAAALAGCGQGQDAANLDDRERTRLRQQALIWLRADLAAWRKQLESDKAKARPVVQQVMQHWLRDTDFGGVRGPEALAKLPPGERQDWRKLWSEVTELFTKAGGKSLGQAK